MFYRACLILGSIALLALGACSGKQTARTHVESSEHQLALGLSPDWEHVDGVYERGTVDEHSAPQFHGLDPASRESALVDAQRLLELLNSGRTDEALALIQQLGLSPGGGSTSAIDPEALYALMAQLRGGGNASVQQMLGAGGLEGGMQGLALPELDVPDVERTPRGSAVDQAFESHRKAFDSIGP